VFLETKKDGPTKGKMFWTCQKNRPAQCGFFLWEEHAKTREAAALLTSTGTEPPFTPATPRTNPYAPKPFRGMDSLPRGASSSSEEEDNLGPETPTRTNRATSRASTRISRSINHNGSVSPPPSQRMDSRGSERRRGRSPATSVITSPTILTTPSVGAQSRKQVAFASPISTPSAKRKRDVFENDDDDYAFDDLDSDTERQLVNLAAQSDEQNQTQSQTQSGASFETPRAQRTHDMAGGLPTPVSRNPLLLVSEQREAKRQKENSTQSSATVGRSTITSEIEPPGTPTPSRAGEAPSSSPSGRALEDQDLTSEVMGLLEGSKLESSVRIAVRRALEKHAMRITGVIRGRDMARSVLKSRDARIAELQDRLVQLQTQKATNRIYTQRVYGNGVPDLPDHDND
jgi:hypothetical protein